MVRGIGLALALAGWPAAQSVAGEASRLVDSRDYVHPIGMTRLGDGRIVITLRVDDGFHINANPASQPYLIPTSVSFPDLSPARVVYPQPVTFKPKFADDVLDVYEGTVSIMAFFASAELEEIPRLRAIVTVQACSDRICFAPADLSVSE